MSGWSPKRAQADKADNLAEEGGMRCQESVAKRLRMSKVPSSPPFLGLKKGLASFQEKEDFLGSVGPWYGRPFSIDGP